jgi:hypothetical protein
MVSDDMADNVDLAGSQRWLASLILDPELLDRDHAGTARRITIEDPGLCVERLLAYVNGYPARIFEALGEAFPATKHVVGDYRFAELTNRYRPHLPTETYNLNDVGMNLSEFLRSDELGKDFEFAADLTQLEWRVQCAFHAREGQPFDVSALSKWTMDDWSGASVEFQPSVAVVRSAWPIIEIWDSREIPLEQIDIDLRDRPQNVLVYRRGYRVVCDGIGDDEALTFEELASGSTLGVAMQRLAENDLAPETVTTLFRRAAGNGLITACRAAAP